MQRRNRELKDLLYKKLYRHYRVVRMQVKAERLSDLFHAYQAEPSMLPDHVQFFIEKRGLERTICDYIAGMTDRYAIEEHQKLFNPLKSLNCFSMGGTKSLPHFSFPHINITISERSDSMSNQLPYPRRRSKAKSRTRGTQGTTRDELSPDCAPPFKWAIFRKMPITTKPRKIRAFSRDAFKESKPSCATPLLSKKLKGSGMLSSIGSHVTIQEEGLTLKPITSSVPPKQTRAREGSLTNPPSAAL
jgi:hypothetical protein